VATLYQKALAYQDEQANLQQASEPSQKPFDPTPLSQLPPKSSDPRNPAS
jgi:hypothetical protein